MQSPIYNSMNKVDRGDEVGPNQFQEKAKRLVVEHYNSTLDIVDTELERITKDDVYVVWFVKVLQNWKALVSTDKAKGVYYEITYNGDTMSSYVDQYLKTDNLTVED